MEAGDPRTEETQTHAVCLDPPRKVEGMVWLNAQVDNEDYGVGAATEQEVLADLIARSPVLAGVLRRVEGRLPVQSVRLRIEVTEVEQEVLGR